MIPLEDMEALLEEISGEFPEQLFDGLNGGIILLPEAKLNAHSRNNDLFILGEYHSGGNLGRYIAIYYGSFMHVYGHLGYMQLKEQLVHTLKHEFTHHLESLAGEKSLEVKDAMFLADYLKHSGRPD